MIYKIIHFKIINAHKIHNLNLFLLNCFETMYYEESYTFEIGIAKLVFILMTDFVDFRSYQTHICLLRAVWVSRNMPF